MGINNDTNYSIGRKEKRQLKNLDVSSFLEEEENSLGSEY